LRGSHFGELGAQLLGPANLQLVEITNVFFGKVVGSLACSIINDALKLIGNHF
jgi:hypothetical protein